MFEVLTCVEHQWIPIKSQRKPGDFALSEAQAKQLSQSKTLPADAFRWGQKAIQWRQYCGVVQLSGLTIEILPKIYGHENQPQKCRAVLLKMLRKVGIMRLYREQSAAVSVQRHVLLDIFIHEFCRLLDEQNRMGRPRDYQQQEENLVVIKGKLLINQQLRLNQSRPDRLYCQFDEFTEDVLLNQIIKYCLRLLQPQCRANTARQGVARLLMQYADMSDGVFLATDIDRIHLNRTNDRYDTVLEWCRLFLSGLKPNVHAGQHAMLSILFDMNLLFERWVAAELRPLARKHGLVLRQQQPHDYLALRIDSQQKVFQTRPDLALSDQQGRLIKLLDTKWKLLSPDDARLGVSQADAYQMSSYGHLYGVPELALIYPRQSGLAAYYPLQLRGQVPLALDIHSVDVERGLEDFIFLRQCNY